MASSIVDNEGMTPLPRRPITDLVEEQRTAPFEQRGPREPMQLDKPKVAGLLLIVVFIIGVISAVAISMFQIHLLSLSEFNNDEVCEVVGNVLDEEGKPLEDVSIAIHGTEYFTRTNSDGYFVITAVEEGDYEVEASLSGYVKVTKRVTINTNLPKQVNFILEKGTGSKTINERTTSHLEALRFMNYATAIAILILVSFAFVAGILAFFKKMYWFTIFGGLCGIVGGLFSMGIIITPILSIIALVLIFRSREEFYPAGKTLGASFLGFFKKGPTEDRIQGYDTPQRTFYQAYPQTPGDPYQGGSPPQTQEGYVTQPPRPMGEGAMEEPKFTRKVPSSGGEEVSRGVMCLICNGQIKSSLGTVVCKCGAQYHNFCARRSAKCMKCGAQLPVL